MPSASITTHYAMTSPIPERYISPEPQSPTSSDRSLPTTRSSSPFIPHTILELEPLPRTPFADSPSLANGVRYYDVDSASGEWPMFERSKGHRLHDITGLCRVCDRLDIDALRRGGKLRYHHRDIISAARDCRLCALIAQSYRCYYFRRYWDADGLKDCSPMTEWEDVVEVSLFKGRLALNSIRLWYHGQRGAGKEAPLREEWRWTFGHFRALSAGEASDTHPSESPPVVPATASGSLTDANASRLLSELKRVIARRAPCKICAPGSLPLHTGRVCSPKPLRIRPILPDRVIEILSPLGTPAGKIMLRLKETNGEETAMYTTLSHRWGGDDTFKTTSGTLQHHLRWFNIKELPRTFQDAVLVSHVLGISYVWIDSLCIIQDDVGDWLRQAAKMGSIYLHSTFTIAAHSAAQCNEGFLWRCQVPSTLTIAPAAGGPKLIIEMPEIFPLTPKDLHHSEISNRAWILQELMLSPRVLHFYENHLFWECEHANGFTSHIHEFPSAMETSVPFATTAGLFHRASGKTGVYDAWLQLVHRYSTYEMTFGKDKLVALEGIINAMCRILAEKGGAASQAWYHHCGIFEADVHRSLLWYLPFEDILHGPERHLQRAPSWSWASVDHKVYFAAVEEGHSTAAITVRHLRLESRRHQDYTDPAVICPSCRLFLKAPVIRLCAELSKARGASSARPIVRGVLTPVSMRECRAGGQEFGWSWPDGARVWPTLLTGEKTTLIEDLTFIAVQSRDFPESHKVAGVWCLMITPIQGIASVYRRIGIAFIRGDRVKEALERLEAVTLV